MERHEFIILGAGISGLAAAKALLDAGIEAPLLDGGPFSGGLTRSIAVGDYCFDYTGHLLHLARCATPSQVPYASLRDLEWQRIDRHSACYLDGCIVPAPAQYHLAAFPEALRQRCVDSYERRPPMPQGAVSFRDYVISGFGEALAEQFLIPQNEKTQAISLEQLGTAAIKRFFPPPDESKVRAGMIPGNVPPPEYNSRFWYPMHGGIERLVSGLASGIERFHPFQRLASLDLESRTLTTSRGETWGFDTLITSIPLKALLLAGGDPELRAKSASLTNSGTAVFNLGVKGELGPDLSRAHWVYVPQRAIPFYRVGMYSNLSGSVCPKGHHALYVEVGIPGDQVAGLDLAGLQEEVIASLDGLGWVRQEQIEAVAANVMPCAYVHHTPARERVIGTIMDRLAGHGVHPIGRYGLWDYISMEDSIHSGIDTARRLLESRVTPGSK